ncbi:MAG: elongation factor P [Mollicutes bacterium]|nr:elongation factor P [Mollicutes bacterium]MDY3210094.1 elongation factor P [Candidatus Enterosoma sp.]MCI7132878.1 elongation factor P [Mollicutes bacterium]MCI7788913.1 elongation factor P [Mollicutes bacterium]MDD7036435.1 elongation factor P [Mollicutes bacterium]
MADIIDAGELKPGTVYLYKGELLSVVDIIHNKTAMAKRKHKIKAKNLRSGAISERMLFSGETVERAFLDKKNRTLCYRDGDENGFAHFMDDESYEMVDLPISHVKNELQYLPDNSKVIITYFGQEILGIQLPDKVALEIVDTDDNAVAGDTVNKASKDAVLETGLKIKVPRFIKNHTKVWVKTSDGSYDSRA